MEKNKLEKLFDRLREEGWFCGWAEMCCSSCAWMSLPDEHDIGPFKGEDVDLSKVLFNHEQDCENWDDEELDEESEDSELEYDHISTLSSDQMSSSCFCFDGRKEGVKNLKAILPIIEEMGCTYHWNGKGDQRIDIDWSENDGK